jgi:hypothetical protein
VIGEWLDQWKVPVDEKKGTKGKEQEVDLSQKSSSPTTNTRKSSQCTQPTESVTIVKKERKKETIPRASVLGTEWAKGTNGKHNKKDNILDRRKEVETYQRQRTLCR